MRFAYWSREIAGWALILFGVVMFWNAYGLLLNKRIFEAAPAVFIAFIVFRGGIHVLKIAVAAQAARMLPDAARPVARRPSRATPRPVGPTPPQSIIPGPKAVRPAAANSRD